MSDAFGDRMKMYEGSQRHMPLLPVCVRLDGKRFSKFTKGLARPYDERLSTLMTDLTTYLVSATQARIGYTQSDEVSLVYYSDNTKSQIFLDGRVQKMTSLLAAMATAFFLRNLDERLPEKAGQMPIFDCRTWTVPNKTEAANVLLWREIDATKNSISMAASSVYSHKELLHKSGRDKQEMLHAKGINWNDYPAFFKRGVFVQRQRTERQFTVDEISKLPERHEARRNPDLRVSRSDVRVIDMPPFGRVTNRADVVFDGAQPEIS